MQIKLLKHVNCT